jgi:hypothetical protein
MGVKLGLSHRLKVSEESILTLVAQKDRRSWEVPYNTLYSPGIVRDGRIDGLNM